MNQTATNITLFATPSELREWFEENHDRSEELWVGFYKKGSGKPSITYPEALNEALCFGWIDGVRKSIDTISYTIRFTPRKPRSVWSAVNIKRVQELTELSRVRPAGRKAFEERAGENLGYALRNEAQLGDAYEQRFSTNRKAWDFFQSQPPGYRRTAIFWVMDAKREETRLKRLAVLIEDSEKRRRLGALRRPERAP